MRMITEMFQALALALSLLLASPALAGDVYNPGFSSVGDYPDVDNPSGSSTIACSYTPVTTGTQNIAYTGATPSASGGVPAYTFSETGSLPSGLSINSSTGVISGTPTVSGTFPGIQIKVADTVPTTVNCGAAFSLIIGTSSITITQLESPLSTSTNGSIPATFANVAVSPTGLTVYTICHGPNDALITAVSIGITAAVQASGARHDSGAGVGCDIWYASGATGPATLSITFGSTVESRIVVGVYGVTGTPTPTFSVAGGNNTASGTSLTASISIPANGGAIAAAMTHSVSSGSGTPTNISLDTNNLVVGTSTSYIGENVTNSGSTNIGVSWTGATDAALTIVTFNP
jgi:Putative Ig domain